MPSAMAPSSDSVNTAIVMQRRLTVLRTPALR
jgi:hypothetical protein